MSAVQMVGGRMDEALKFGREAVVVGEALCEIDSSDEAQDMLSRCHFQLAINALLSQDGYFRTNVGCNHRCCNVFRRVKTK